MSDIEIRVGETLYLKPMRLMTWNGYSGDAATLSGAMTEVHRCMIERTEPLSDDDIAVQGDTVETYETSGVEGKFVVEHVIADYAVLVRVDLIGQRLLHGAACKPLVMPLHKLRIVARAPQSGDAELLAAIRARTTEAAISQDVDRSAAPAKGGKPLKSQPAIKGDAGFLANLLFGDAPVKSMQDVALGDRVVRKPTIPGAQGFGGIVEGIKTTHHITNGKLRQILVRANLHYANWHDANDFEIDQ